VEDDVVEFCPRWEMRDGEVGWAHGRFSIGGE
jgi:hypothetical protein